MGPNASGSHGVAMHWSNGDYIWGYEGLAPQKQMPDVEGMGLTSVAVQLFMADPVWLTKVLAYRMFYYVSLVRPFNHVLENVVLAFYMLFIYYFALKSSMVPVAVIKKSKSILSKFKIFNSMESMLFWSIFAVQGGLVAITWADWSGRWLLRVMPFLILMSGPGMITFAEKIGFSGFLKIESDG